MVWYEQTKLTNLMSCINSMELWNSGVWQISICNSNQLQGQNIMYNDFINSNRIRYQNICCQEIMNSSFYTQKYFCSISKGWDEFWHKFLSKGMSDIFQPTNPRPLWSTALESCEYHIRGKFWFKAFQEDCIRSPTSKIKLKQNFEQTILSSLPTKIHP